MVSRLLRFTSTVALLLLTSPFLSTALAQQTKVTAISWNVESGGSQPATVGQRIRSFQGVDLWGFSEVQDDAATSVFETAAEDGENANFERITGTTGASDRLAIVYNATRFEKVRHFELHDINPNGRVRAPLVAHLRNRATGQEFLFMVNHLYRSNNTARHQQAQLLNQWARTQTLPVVAVGDYNFDWEVENGDQDHDTGYDNMVKDGAFTWVRPPTLIKSQCSEEFNSVLDFVFTSTPALGWTKSSEILTVANDCPDTTSTPDHRPVRAVLDMVAGPPPDVVTKEQILQKIAALEAELARLKELVRRLP